MLKLFKICSVFLILLLQFNCTNKKDVIIDPPTPEIPKIKKRLLDFYTANTDGGYSAAMVYDSSGRFSGIGTQNNPDYKFFFKDDTIHYVLGPVSTFNGLAMRESWVFLYGPDKKFSKVLKRYRESFNWADVADTNPYFSSHDHENTIYYDSLVYSPTGQIAEIWSGIKHSTQYYVLIFIYSDPNQKAPTQIKEYAGVGFDFSQYIPQSSTVFTYNETEPLVRRQLWFLAFMGIRVPVTPTTPATQARKFLVLLEKSIRKFSFYSLRENYQWHSPNFIYYYNSDSTSYIGRFDPEDMSFAQFRYYFTEKEF